MTLDRRGKRWGFAFLLLAGAVLLGATLWSRQSAARAALMRADPERILTDPKLMGVATTMGREVFQGHCAVCHGAHGQGDPALGAPNLRDRDHLYGEGRVTEIEGVVLHGIRSGDRRGWNLASMPAYGRARPAADPAIVPLSPRETDDVVSYLLGLQGHAVPAEAVQRGKAVYAAHGCWDCHGWDAGGDPAIGAPDLADPVTLYDDGSRAALVRSIRSGRAGVSPAFARSLSPVEARAVSVYVASLAMRQ